MLVRAIGGKAQDIVVATGFCGLFLSHTLASLNDRIQPMKVLERKRIALKLWRDRRALRRNSKHCLGFSLALQFSYSLFKSL